MADTSEPSSDTADDFILNVTDTLLERDYIQTRAATAQCMIDALNTLGMDIIKKGPPPTERAVCSRVRTSIVLTPGASNVDDLIHALRKVSLQAKITSWEPSGQEATLIVEETFYKLETEEPF